MFPECNRIEYTMKKRSLIRMKAISSPWSVAALASLLSVVLGVVIIVPAWAIDVSPSKNTVPERFRNPPGKRFSLFSGDPTRVQQANEVVVERFRVEVSLEPASFSLKELNEGKAIEMTATLRVTNRDSDKSYTLSFADAQRYDLAITTLDDRLIYLWSADKEFAQVVGSSFVNSGETLAYRQTIPLREIRSKFAPGTVYQVKMILANYPELIAAAALRVNE
jgi:hypothetical protein